MNQCCPEYYDQLLEANSDILRTMSQKSDRKYMFASVCKAITLGYYFHKDRYFQNVGRLASIMNDLILNTAERFNFRNIS